MSTRTNSRRGVLTATAVAVVAAAAAFFATVALLGGSPADAGEKIEYRINEAGQTYGALPSDDSAPPDLVLVIGNAGKEGYIDSAAFAGPAQNPEEAARFMESDRAKSGFAVPVYESDGKTRIDEFTFEPANGFAGNPSEK